MEVPKISLVDGAGNRIGIFSKDFDWWQNVKKKFHRDSNDEIAYYQQLRIENETRGKSTTPSPPGQLEMNDLTDSKINLIETELKTNQKKAIKMTIDTAVDPEILEKEREKREHMKNNCKQIGETPLHVAIMHDDLITLKYLIEKKGLDVNQRSCDSNFVGGFSEHAKLIEKSEYEDLAYYGEYPLCIAACFGSKEIYDYLIDKGADPNLIDSCGNSLLHVLVINDRLEMFLYASNHPKKKALTSIVNKQGLTPFNLSAKLARKDMFTKMLEINEIMMWQYSNITCSVYPLVSIDTILPDGSIDPLSSLGFIVNGETDEHLDMLRIGFIDRLLEDKWAQFAQTALIKKAIFTIFHLIFLTIAVYTRAGDYPLVAKPTASANTVVRYIAESLTFIMCIVNLLVQARELKVQGVKEYFNNLLGEPANVFYNIFCILICFAFPFRFIDTGNPNVTGKNVEDVFVIIAIPCGWMHMLFYARVATLTGPFVVMIYKMLVGDILIFSTVFSVFLVGFSMGFYYLYKDAGEAVSTLGNYQESLYQTFLWTLGDFTERIVEFDRVLHSELVKIIFVVFLIFLNIMLFNMLIAMMGNTYSIINAKSEKEWRKQWAHSILLLEQSFGPEELKGFQNRYCMALPDPDPTKPDRPVLMVIKKINSTKALVNRRTMGLWKTSTKAVRNELRSRQMKGVELLARWENKKAPGQPGARKAVDWSLYGGVPKNRMGAKKPENKPMPVLKDEEEVQEA